MLLDESFRLIEGCVSDILKMCQATFLDGENYVFSGRFISRGIHLWVVKEIIVWYVCIYMGMGIPVSPV